MRVSLFIYTELKLNHVVSVSFSLDVCCVCAGVSVCWFECAFGIIVRWAFTCDDVIQIVC